MNDCEGLVGFERRYLCSQLFSGLERLSERCTQEGDKNDKGDKTERETR